MSTTEPTTGPSEQAGTAGDQTGSQTASAATEETGATGAAEQTAAPTGSAVGTADLAVGEVINPTGVREMPGPNWRTAATPVYRDAPNPAGNSVALPAVGAIPTQDVYAEVYQPGAKSSHPSYLLMAKVGVVYYPPW